MRQDKSKIEEVEMWELMRDWFTSLNIDYTLGYVFPANQVFTLRNKAVQVWRCYPEINVFDATGNPNCPYKQTATLDSRDPECFNKLKKLLN
jgi:hypothetical protein